MDMDGKGNEMHAAEDHVLKVALAANPGLQKDGWHFVKAELIDYGVPQWIFVRQGESADMRLYCISGVTGWRYSTAERQHA